MAVTYSASWPVRVLLSFSAWASNEAWSVDFTNEAARSFSSLRAGVIWTRTHSTRASGLPVSTFPVKLDCWLEWRRKTKYNQIWATYKTGLSLFLGRKKTEGVDSTPYFFFSGASRCWEPSSLTTKISSRSRSSLATVSNLLISFQDWDWTTTRRLFDERSFSKEWMSDSNNEENIKKWRSEPTSKQHTNSSGDVDSIHNSDQKRNSKEHYKLHSWECCAESFFGDGAEDKCTLTTTEN